MLKIHIIFAIILEEKFKIRRNMKKVIDIFLLIIIFLIIYFLQVNFIARNNIAVISYIACG